MLDKLKSFLSKYKVHVAVVGGVLVVATTFGTCSFNPLNTSDDANDAVEVTPVVNTTTEGTTTEGTTTEGTTTEGTTTESTTD